MERRFRQLARGPFDLLVIGGGIYGAWAAYDAALRGLSVALIEAEDWGAGTSQASSKLIHGGLRYLEHRDFDLVRKSLDERRRLAWLAPHRVHPLRFVLPVYAGDRVGRLKLRLGLWLYDRMAGKGIEEVGSTEPVDPETLVQRFGLRPEGLRGGFAFGDCQTDDARFTLEIVAGALEAGAVAVNHARATELLVEHGRVRGATVRDLESGTTCRVRAEATLNCTGAWVRRLIEPHHDGFSDTLRLTKGIHLVMPALPRKQAYLLPSNDDGRIVFLLPWYGKTLLGTTDTEFRDDPDSVRVDEGDVVYLLERARRLIPDGPWDRSDVISGFCGLRTLPDTSNRSPTKVSRDWRLDEPLEGMLVAVGGKFTSARADAVVMVNRVMKKMLKRDLVPSSTAQRMFPWAPEGDFSSWRRAALAQALSLGLDEETGETCVLRQGTRIEAIFKRLREAPQLAARVVEDAPFCRAEVVHALSDEMALSLADVLRRRVPVLLVSSMPEAALRDVTAMVASELQWSPRRRERELAALNSEFKPALTTHGNI